MVHNYHLLILCVAVIWYTGHGERETGNWCFQDGVISFEDIFILYMKHFQGKLLNLTCDCSYSSRWAEQCAKKLDEIGIASCGHHTREQGILIRVFCSCEKDQQATMLTYCNEGVVVENELPWYYNSKKLTSAQTTLSADFTDIRCQKRPEENCEIPPHLTWMDCIIKIRYIYLVQGHVNNRGRLEAAWLYVLVDKEKQEGLMEDDFTFNDAKCYGRILCSGYGKVPPEEVQENIQYYY